MPTQEEKYKETLAKYLPLSAVDPVYRFVDLNRVRFRIAASRSSKLGDYRMPQSRHPFHEISVNGDLPPYFFLMVLLHEMAHLNTFLDHGRSVQPHGHEWQEHYRRLLADYSAAGHFPPETRTLFDRYTAGIPLNRELGRQIEKALKRTIVDPQAETAPSLSDLPVGSLFSLKRQPGRTFRSMEKIRTRFRCVETGTNRIYLISGSAEVNRL